MRRRAFKRTASKQYGWASYVTSPRAIVTVADVFQDVVVGGDTDIEVRALGNTHGNLKRIVGDISFAPGYDSDAETFTTPVSWHGTLHWALILVDNEDTTDYAPNNPIVLSEERILAHGHLSSAYHRFRLPENIGGTTTNYDGIYGHMNLTSHIDVGSNRRIRSDDDVRLYAVWDGTLPDSQQENAGIIQASLRALLKFP